MRDHISKTTMLKLPDIKSRDSSSYDIEVKENEVEIPDFF